jgi:hypothetical protein
VSAPRGSGPVAGWTARWQLAWRDFFHQVTAGFPRIAEADYHWNRDWDDA